MKVTVLGSGSFEARTERSQAGYAVQDGETQILIDLGSGTLGRCCRAGIEPAATTALCVTHMHPDHLSDLVAFLFELKHRRPAWRREDFPIYGPPTFGRVFDRLMDVFGQWCVGEEYDLQVRELEREEVAIGSLRVRAFPVVHSVPALGFRIADGRGRVVAFTGDTGPGEELAPLAERADVLVCDCTLPAGCTFDGHLNAHQAGALAEAAGVARLVLTHISPEADAVDVVEQASECFTGEVVKAEDFLVIEL